MITKVVYSYPSFSNDGLKREFNFKKGINIIEAENGFGKTVLCNTIMSAYTNKYPGMRTLPNGNATIETDTDTYLLSMNKWIGTKEENPLYTYCMPGKFFELKSTTEQRKVLIDLLDLDYNTFMKNECDKVKSQFKHLEWKDDLEKSLNSKLKELEIKEKSILEDINRLKSECINFEVKTFEDIDRFNEDRQSLIEKIKEYNDSIFEEKEKYNRKINDLNILKSKLNNPTIGYKEKQLVDLNNQLTNLRKEYTNTKAKAFCDKCGSELNDEKKQLVLDGLVQSSTNIKESIQFIQLEIDSLVKEQEEIKKQIDSTNIEPKDFVFLQVDDLVSCAITLDVDIIIPSQERLKEYEEYNIAKNKNQRTQEELKYKEDAIRSIDTLELQMNIDKLKEIKELFTKKLEEATASLPLDIELFQVLKNGNVRETFTIKKDGVDYYDLSQGNKLVVNIMLAKLFIDKLGLDFILLDEFSVISKDNLTYIKELSKKYQLIICKATAWSLKDFK